MQALKSAPRPELVFALVGPVGVRLEDLRNRLKVGLESFTYQTVEIRLSDLLTNAAGWSEQTSAGEEERIRHLQKLGDAFRTLLEDGSALALAAIAEIRAARATLTGNPDQPADSQAYILHQLKHPDEVDLLRRVYGNAFFLIGGYAPRPVRIDALASRLANSTSRAGDPLATSAANDIVVADEKQANALGQNTRDTYPKADYFVDMGVPGREAFEVTRFLELIFGHPFRTPTPDEYAMNQASAVALRSSDDNRQVGAAIVSLARRAEGKVIANADVIAVGTNEVPRGGGGFYWDHDSPDNRDQALLDRGENRAERIKESVLAELIGKMRGRELLQGGLKDDNSTVARSLLPDLKGTRFMDIGEFSRPVHAEMAALIDAARRGVAVNTHTMYVTTFPCHNCAKHIIAAGIRRVIYLEPYPKSRVELLYPEEIAMDSPRLVEEDKVIFNAYSGLAPRQYSRLFSMADRGAKLGNSQRKWNSERSALRPLHLTSNASALSAIEERQALDGLPLDAYERDATPL